MPTVFLNSISIPSRKAFSFDYFCVVKSTSLAGLKPPSLAFSQVQLPEVSNQHVHAKWQVS